MCALLDGGHDEEAGALLDAYPDDIMAVWPFALTLWRFRAEGDDAPAREALAASVCANSLVVGYLVKPESRPVVLPPHFVLGSKEEVASLADILADAFEAMPGAL